MVEHKLVTYLRNELDMIEIMMCGSDKIENIEC